MKPEDIPERWVEAAMTGAAPGCRDDARFYLANAYETIRADLLWETSGESLTYITCACGRSWYADIGPDEGHGQHDCPSAADAVLRINGCRIQLYTWHLTPLGVLDDPDKVCWQIGGWLRAGSEHDQDIYTKPVLESADLPGRTCPTGQKVWTEVSGDGTGRLFFKAQWRAKR